MHIRFYQLAALLSSLFIYLSCDVKNSSQKQPKGFAEKLRVAVLSEDSIGLEYFSKIMLKNQVLEYRNVFLGNINMKNGGQVKFLYQVTFFGLYEDSKRANARIYLYNNNYKEIGHYYIEGNYYSLKIKDDTLFIMQKSNSCSAITEISFRDSIPHNIFILCDKNDGKGDVYTFSTDETE